MVIMVKKAKHGGMRWTSVGLEKVRGDDVGGTVTGEGLGQSERDTRRL